MEKMDLQGQQDLEGTGGRLLTCGVRSVRTGLKRIQI
jgi:hypothetical protein